MLKTLKMLYIKKHILGKQMGYENVITYFLAVDFFFVFGRF